MVHVVRVTYAKIESMERMVMARVIHLAILPANILDYDTFRTPIQKQKYNFG